MSVTVGDEIERVFSGFSLDIVQESSGSFSIAHKESYLADAQRMLDFVKGYEFETDDDRKAAKKAKAEVTKLDKAFKAKLKAQETAMFGEARADMAEIAGALNEVVSYLGDRIDFFDNKYQVEKRDQIAELFASAVKARSAEIAGSVDVENVWNARWLNRSMPLSKVASDIDSRLEAVESLASLGDVDEALVTLQKYRWDTSKALSAVMKRREDERREAEQVADEEAREVEAEVSEPEEVVYRVARVMVPDTQMRSFRREMRRNGWSFEYVDEL